MRQPSGTSARLSPRSPRSPGREAGGPPRLVLPIWRNLGLMALLNIVPLLGLSWALVSWDHGPHWRPHQERGLALTLGAAVVCLVIAVSAWVLLPLARWLRAYPRWQLAHRRSWAWWLLPALLGWLAWALLGFGALIAVLASVLAVVLTVLHLAGVW
jgi:hypothetical protein